MLFKRIKFNTSFTGSFKIVFSGLKQGKYLFKSINSLKEKFTWLSTVNGSFHFFFSSPESYPSNKDLSSLLSYIKTILTKDFITQGFQSQHHNSFKKKQRKEVEGRGKDQIPEPNTRQNTSLKIGHITNYFKPKEKKKKEILGSHFVSGFYYLSKIGKLNSGLLAHKITSSNDQGMQT